MGIDNIWVFAQTADGEATGLLSHVTKVFLVDADGRVRNVYSTGFLDHRLLLRDVETVLASAGGERASCGS